MTGAWDELVLRARQGEVRAAARLMTLVENQPERLPDLWRELADRPRPRLVLGLTGAPGSGKSTLTDALVVELRQRHPAARLGVIAVDPSSPFTGGAVLGDRVRMMRHATDPAVFIRSMASRGHLGGLALGVKGVLRVMELIGCEWILLETVGVGQSEVEVAKVADLVAVVLAPGQGDGIQLLKAGLIEIGDVFIVNKADRPGADELHAQLMEMIRLNQAVMSAGTDDVLPESPASGSALDLALERGRRPTPTSEVFLVSATAGTGIPAVLEALEGLAQSHAQAWTQRRSRSLEADVQETILEAARRRLQRLLADHGGRSYLDPIASGQATLDEVVRQLLSQSGKQTVEDISTSRE